MTPQGRSRVPDYTGAFLGSALALVFVALFAIWAAWGLPAALTAGWAADRAIVIAGRRRQGRSIRPGR